VRQDRKQGLTIFDQEFTERRGAETQSRTFSLAFRTLSVPQWSGASRRPGSRSRRCWATTAARWDPRADVWVILARKR
jgi:hypothetical protein